MRQLRLFCSACDSHVVTPHVPARDVTWCRARLWTVAQGGGWVGEGLVRHGGDRTFGLRKGGKGSRVGNAGGVVSCLAFEVGALR